jgi:hypothetical protein
MSSPPPAGTLDPVQCVAFAVPVLPGQAEAARVALASCRAGACKEAYQDARVAVVMDVPDLDALTAAMATQEAADAMEHDGVLADTVVFLVEA